MAMKGPIQRKDHHHHHQKQHETKVDSRDVEEAIIRTTTTATTITSNSSCLLINRQGDNNNNNNNDDKHPIEDSSSLKINRGIINVDDDDDDDDNSKEPSSSLSTTIVIGLQIANVLSWYWTNGMNGIAMQGYAGRVNNSIINTMIINTISTNNKEEEKGLFIMSSKFWTILEITSGITCIQLFLGSLIGRILLFVINKQITWEQICMTRSISLSSLHAGGSLATNLGFMYGKASVIQVIKLLEPFETLCLSQILFREGNFSIGIISSMILVVGAAMSLLKLQSKPPSSPAIIFALLSGLTLSTRNVLQRKHHHTSVVAKSWTKLEKSVVQFIQLSFFSGLWMAAVTSILFLFVHGQTTITASWQVFLWHPLYNIFSMITLGFCSALTHSLLNAGKRVFAICMAMLWFAEGLYDSATLSGLFAVASGGGWYSWEGKRKRSCPSSSSFVTVVDVEDCDGKHGSEIYKLIFSISVLVSLFTFHNAAK